MRTWLAISLIALGLAVLPACSSASSATGTALTTAATVVAATASPGMSADAQPKHRAVVRLSPSSGSAHTAFVVGFKAPQAAGASGIRQTSYQITALGPRGSGCEFSAQRTIRKARKGAHERIALRPQERGWCRGTFHGVVRLVSGPNCVTGQVCPQFVSVVATVGRFKFSVK